MSVYAISFRIADRTTGYGSYDERYTSVVEATQALTQGRYWEETTSFLVLESSHDSSASLATSIEDLALFDPAVDLLLVINLSRKGFAVRGKNDDPDVEEIMAKR
ncbi:hypothetical protein [Nitratireductor thuwali]|uniref:Uncharacterized protein n=1 Tax=Nitratireductor thuwali TaxID=2267699 RepID=A0ABY5MNG0_9HYPH|nr:hypothetical protein NTH_04022 [Nitratireductor thuwali]